MEDVLDVYQRPYDADRPVVCVDETCRQLIGETRVPVAAAPGRPRREDYEYRRNGTANLFMMFEPLAARRTVQVTAQRTAADFARVLRDLADVHYPKAEKIVLVCDNLNTHTPAALYAVFAPAEARRLSQRFEWHYTPKHGSWLNMAEIELGVLARQCLDRRIEEFDVLRRETAAWQRRRDGEGKTVDWQFTTADARVKLKRLYPSLRA